FLLTLRRRYNAIAQRGACVIVLAIRSAPPDRTFPTRRRATSGCRVDDDERTAQPARRRGLATIIGSRRGSIARPARGSRYGDWTKMIVLPIEVELVPF